VHHGAADKRIKNFGSNWTPAPIVKEILGLSAGEIRIRMARAHVFTLLESLSLSHCRLPTCRRRTCPCVYPHFPRVSNHFTVLIVRFRIPPPPRRAVIGSVIGTNTATIAAGIFNTDYYLSCPVVSLSVPSFATRRSSLLLVKLNVSTRLITAADRSKIRVSENVSWLVRVVACALVTCC